MAETKLAGWRPLQPELQLKRGRKEDRRPPCCAYRFQEDDASAVLSSALKRPWCALSDVPSA